MKSVECKVLESRLAMRIEVFMVGLADSTHPTSKKVMAPASRQHFVDNSAIHVGQAEVTALIAIG